MQHREAALISKLAQFRARLQPQIEGTPIAPLIIIHSKTE
jgi:hypothetical protein